MFSCKVYNINILRVLMYVRVVMYVNVVIYVKL